MKSSFIGIALALTLVGCGQRDQAASDVQADAFEAKFFGFTVGSCTLGELQRFVNGEDVPSIAGKMTPAQRLETRQKLSRVFHVSTKRVEEVLGSELGHQFESIMKDMLKDNGSAVRVPSTFRAVVKDGSFTVLEFLAAYPVPTLRIDGFAFSNREGELRSVLEQMEQSFAK